MRRIEGVVLLVLFLVVPGALRADPQDGTREKLKELEQLLRQIEDAGGGAGPEFRFQAPKTVARIYNVADLTVRLDDFTHANLLLRPAGSEVSEDQPVFGKADEGETFFADVDDLVDQIRANVRPEVWESEGSQISTSGPLALLVVAEPDVQEEVRAYLDGLRQSVGRLVTVELRVLKLPDGVEPPPSDLSPEEGAALLAKAEAKDGVELAGSARITGFSGQRVSFFSGRQRSFVQDYDVEVAVNSQIADPIVGVFQTGLSFDVRPVARGEDLVVLDLRGQLVGADEPLRTLETSAGTVQTPKARHVEFATNLTVANGAYALVSAGDAAGGGQWLLLVSARSEHMQRGGGK